MKERFSLKFFFSYKCVLNLSVCTHMIKFINSHVVCVCVSDYMSMYFFLLMSVYFVCCVYVCVHEGVEVFIVSDDMFYLGYLGLFYSMKICYTPQRPR